MRQMSFAAAIEDALMQAMAADPRIVIFGEDVHAIRMNLFARFGEMRVRPIPISKAVREGNDLTMVSVGVGVHRCPEAAKQLAAKGVQAGVVDLRSVQPIDRQTVCAEVSESGRLLVVDEDYESFGLSGELAAVVLEAGITPRFARVCVENTIPYDQSREGKALPNVKRLLEAAHELLNASPDSMLAHDHSAPRGL